MKKASFSMSAICRKLSILSLLLASAAPVFALDFQQEFNGVTFAKWKKDGRPVFNDAARDEEINANVGIVTRTLTLLDYSVNGPTVDQIALTTSTFTVWPKKDDVDPDRFPVCTWDGQSLWWDGNFTLRGPLTVRLVKNLLMNKLFMRRLYDDDVAEANKLVVAGSPDPAGTTADVQQYKSHAAFLRRVYLSLP